MPEEAANGSSALPSPPVHIAAPAARADSTATKPVIINAVTPWLEIARMPQYVKADYAERRAIRDLYWAVCVEAKIPLEQRTSAYWQFVRTWDISESGASDSPTRTTSAQYLREQQPGAPSPVTAETMGKWCKR
jgi:hypothetical protein